MENKIHIPKGATVKPRPTNLIEVEDCKLKKSSSDGNQKNHPTP